jgi:hypothetical protein
MDHSSYIRYPQGIRWCLTCDDEKWKCVKPSKSLGASHNTYSAQVDDPAKLEFGKWLDAQKWEYFLTLTYRNMSSARPGAEINENSPLVYSLDEHYKDNVWTNKAVPPTYSHVKRSVDEMYEGNWHGLNPGLVVLEKGKNPWQEELTAESPEAQQELAPGRFHLHGLANFKSWKDVNFFSAMWEWKHGWNSIQPVKSSEAVTRYCQKYVLKEWGRSSQYESVWTMGERAWQSPM